MPAQGTSVTLVNFQAAPVRQSAGGGVGKVRGSMSAARRILRAMMQAPQAGSQLAERREWREIAVLAARLAEVEAALAAQQAQMAAQQARTDNLREGTMLTFAAAGTPVSDALAADAPTLPGGLRIVRATRAG